MGPSRAGNDDGDRRPVDLREAPDVEERGGEHRARVPGGDDCVRVAVAHGAARGDERAVGLRAHCLDRLLVHLDRVCGLHELEALRVEAGGAEEDRLNRARRAPRARPRRSRPGPGRRPWRRPPHERETHSFLRSRRAERLDFAAPVRLAGGADTVRPLRLVADRTLVDAGRLQAMRAPSACRDGRSSVFAWGLPCRPRSIAAASPCLPGGFTGGLPALGRPLLRPDPSGVSQHLNHSEGSETHDEGGDHHQRNPALRRRRCRQHPDEPRSSDTPDRPTPTAFDQHHDRRDHDRHRATPTAGRPAGEDISGPCDEAEHANDPRCTGAPAPSRAATTGRRSP